MDNRHRSHRLARTLKRLRIVAIAALYVGASSWIGLRADDTQIYINKVPSAQTPNVLFSIDTSGSMAETVPDGSGQSRMDAVKQALTGLINDTGNLKAGLGRFHTFIGSPIIFPVRDINKTIGNEEPFPESHTTTSSIARSSDDAEQLSLGTVVTDDPRLELTETQEVVSGYGTVDIHTECFVPEHSHDDDESGATSDASISSPDLDIGTFDSGIRFRDVDIPRNAVILHAEVQFTSRVGSSGATHTTIRGHNVGDSPQYSTPSVTDRITNAATTASVPWSNIRPIATSNVELTTPNIRSIVQEIIERGDWNSGQALGLLFEAQGGIRELLSYDGGASGCGGTVPRLRVKYVEPGQAGQFSRQPAAAGDDAWDGGNDQDATPDFLPLTNVETQFCVFIWCFPPVQNAATTGVRFPDIAIPDGARVLWADIEFTAQAENQSGPQRMLIQGVREGNPQPFNESNREPSDLPRTSASVQWREDLVTEDEEIFMPAESEKFRTPNLAGLVNEIIEDTSLGFQSGNALAFILEDHPASGRNDQLVCSARATQQGLGGCPESPHAKPTLRIFYELPSDGTITTHQQVGFRFDKVGIPQGAEITSAVLELVADTTNSQPNTLNIQVQNHTNPGTFVASTNNISSRTWVPFSGRDWNVEGWQEGERIASVDLSDLVSTVTNQAGWCGGNALAFRIRSDDANLLAKSFDSGSGNAARLQVNYNTSNLLPGEGCTTSRFVTSVTESVDNVFEESGNVRNDAGELRLDHTRTVGLRFKDVGVPPGAVIRNASLELTANREQLDSSTITIQAQDHTNPPSFVTGNTSDVTGRDTVAASVSWTAGAWEEGQTYSPADDLAGLVQPIVSDPDWTSGNALAFILEGSSNRRDIEQCCGSGETPARLVIDYEIDLGDVIEQPVKELLLSTIDSMLPGGNTPLTDALYESGAYFAGEPVHFGRTRGAGRTYDGESQNDSDITSVILNNWYISRDNRILDYNDPSAITGYRNSRLSHPATYAPEATIVQPGNCSESDLNHYDCRREHIQNSQNVTYISPFETAESCERGFLVLLSDGLARDNSSRQLIRNLSGAESCSMQIPILDATSGEPLLPDGDSSYVMRDPTTYEQCGLELAHYLQESDFIEDGPDLADFRNNVQTFTIGFNLDLSRTADRNAVEYLKALAFVGSGGDLDDVEANPEVQYGDGFYTANTADELQLVFEVIVGDIIQETTSFVAPGISINAVNRLYHLNNIYYSLFRPDARVSWLGNLKKFELCEAGQAGCEFGEVVDKNGVPAVHRDENNQDTFGTLKSDAQGLWSAADDAAPEINQGGAGERIPTYTERNVYVYTDSEDPTPPAYTGNTWVQGTSPHKINLGSDVGSEDEATGFTGLKAALHEKFNCNAGSFEEQNDCLNDLIEWLTGKRFPGDISRDGTDDDVDRWAFGDPMHSRPLILTYGIHPGGDGQDPLSLSKVFVGTNDGGIRMINDGDGVEEWIFYPNSMLQRQSELKENPNGAHIYGVDGTPTVRIRDVDGDSVIEPGDGDFIHLYFGFRRGGRQIVALNVTPNQTVNGVDGPDGGVIAEKGLVEPELLWRIDSNSDPLFRRLGYTWSNPIPTRIQGLNGPRTVLIFGGGYDPGGSNSAQDGVDEDGIPPDGGDNYRDDTSEDSMGNAIFIVDANTGERLWWASSANDGDDEAPDALVPEMNASIAAPVTVVDSSEDGHTDRLYAVDMRGQVFRVDIDTATTGNELGGSTVGVLASLGPDFDTVPDDEQAPNQDRRKFFYAPEVARVNDTLVAEAPYDMIGIVSGNRSEPQGKTVLDRAYGIRDFLTENPAGGLTSSNFPACNPNNCPETPIVTNAITHAHLKDVTDKGDFVIREKDENGTLTLSDPDGNEPPTSVLDDLRHSHGWYFDLEGTVDDGQILGEKGFSTATVLDGKMFFTTYLPPESAEDAGDACSVPGVLGTSRFYAVDFFTGAPAFDRNDDGSYDKVERYKNIGGGPSSDVTVVNTPGGSILQVPTRQGSTPEDPGFVPGFNKTFWLEER